MMSFALVMVLGVGEKIEVAGLVDLLIFVLGFALLSTCIVYIFLKG